MQSMNDVHAKIMAHYRKLQNDNEMNEKAVSVRKRGGIDMGAMGVDAFIEQALDEVKTKKIQ